MFMLPMPPRVSGLAAGEGLACGIGMFIGIDMSIFCPGDGEACGAGVGDPAGVCIPGMLFISIFCGDAAGVGEAVGIFMPGMFPIPVCPADGEGVAVGDLGCVRIPRMSMPFMFMPCMPCFFGARLVLCLRRADGLAFDLTFRLAFVLFFGFDMSMPGMSCMLCPVCCARATTAPGVANAEIRMSAHRRARVGFQLLMIPP
ncbi:MAG: hypothetical protein LC746_16570 [Acidobacteria bacterium]|nr:hypothetical protein [Acidobacteriota bacterium]